MNGIGRSDFFTEISLALIDIDHFNYLTIHMDIRRVTIACVRVAQAFAGYAQASDRPGRTFRQREICSDIGRDRRGGALTITEEAVRSVAALGIRHSGSSTSDILTVSVGLVTMRPVIGMTEDRLISTADRALYQARNAAEIRSSLSKTCPPARSRPDFTRRATDTIRTSTRLPYYLKIDRLGGERACPANCHG